MILYKVNGKARLSYMSYDISKKRYVVRFVRNGRPFSRKKLVFEVWFLDFKLSTVRAGKIQMTRNEKKLNVNNKKLFYVDKSIIYTFKNIISMIMLKYN